MSVHGSSWLCNRNTQSKCSNPTHQQAITLIVLSFSAGATVSVRSEIFQLSCRPPAFVIGAVVNWLGVFVIGTSFPFIVVSDFPWDTELKSAAGAGRVTGGDSAMPSRRELSTCSPKAAFQLKGPDLPKIRLKYLSMVKMQRTPYQIQSTLGPK